MVTITLPAGLELLSPNQRLHWAERNRRFQALKKATWAMALHQHIPRMERVMLVIEHQPPDHRRRDPDNAPTASGKPCIDGLVAARVLPADDSRHVLEVAYRIGDPYPEGRLVLHLTEVPAGAQPPPPWQPRARPSPPSGAYLAARRAITQEKT